MQRRTGTARLVQEGMLGFKGLAPHTDARRGEVLWMQSVCRSFQNLCPSGEAWDGEGDTEARTPAGPELDAEVERRGGRCGGPPVNLDQQGRRIPVRKLVVPARRRVVVHVRGGAACGREGDALRLRQECRFHLYQTQKTLTTVTPSSNALDGQLTGGLW